MIKKTIVFVIFTTSIFLAGCASQKMYYMGSYSQTLYSLEKNQTEQAFLKHKQELENIITSSELFNMPVAPGIYAELGHMYFKSNNPQEAIKLFQLESRLYPESRCLMDREIKNVKEKGTMESNVSGLSPSKSMIPN